MSWARLDDDFPNNKKVATLTDVEFRVWIKILCHCAKQEDPSVDTIARGCVVGLTKRRIQTFSNIGLLDPIGTDYEIHDWPKYQPRDKTGADRQAAWRARNKAQKTVTPTVTQTVTPLYVRAKPVPVPVPESLEVLAHTVASSEGTDRLTPTEKLVRACGDTPDAALKINRTIRKHNSAEGDICWALECATGPGVRDPLAVALSELVKRAA